MAYPECRLMDHAIPHITNAILDDESHAVRICAVDHVSLSHLEDRSQNCIAQLMSVWLPNPQEVSSPVVSDTVRGNYRGFGNLQDCNVHTIGNNIRQQVGMPMY